MSNFPLELKESMLGSISKLVLRKASTTKPACVDLYHNDNELESLRK